MMVIRNGYIIIPIFLQYIPKGGFRSLNITSMRYAVLSMPWMLFFWILRSIISILVGSFPFRWKYPSIKDFTQGIVNDGKGDSSFAASIMSIWILFLTSKQRRFLRCYKKLYSLSPIPDEKCHTRLNTARYCFESHQSLFDLNLFSSLRYQWADTSHHKAS